MFRFLKYRIFWSVELKFFLKILLVLGVGFTGGVLAQFFLTLFRPTTLTTLGDAVSIANTYIVFTTIIFVGFTVILGIAGYILTQEFSINKHNQELKIIDELKDKLKSDEPLAVSLIEAVLSNNDVKIHFENILQAKVDELLEIKLCEFESNAAAATADAAKVRELSSGLKSNGKGGSHAQ